MGLIQIQSGPIGMSQDNEIIGVILCLFKREAFPFNAPNPTTTEKQQIH